MHISDNFQWKPLNYWANKGQNHILGLLNLYSASVKIFLLIQLLNSVYSQHYKPLMYLWRMDGRLIMSAMLN